MTDKLLVWVTELTITEPSWSPERIAAWVTRGWSFLGGDPIKHFETKNEIIALVNTLRIRRPTPLPSGRGIHCA